MVLTIDIGNTRTKVAIFDNEKLVEHIVFEPIAKDNIINLVTKYGSFGMTIISSVNAKEEGRIAHILDELCIKYHLLSYQSPLPFAIDYLTPATLGKDRIAALAGAYAIAGEGNYLVIDCGTCNTYDLLIDGHFVGGNIAPGLQMRLDAMHHFTAALPQCSLNDACDPNRPLGETTKTAIWNGAYWGVVNEINGYINRYSKEYKDLKVILTGGLFTLVDNITSQLITPLSSHLAIHEPMLVPMGLNFIANYISNK
jgi:type III pantothenate kinase